MPIMIAQVPAISSSLHVVKDVWFQWISVHVPLLRLIVDDNSLRPRQGVDNRLD